MYNAFVPSIKHNAHQKLLRVPYLTLHSTLQTKGKGKITMILKIKYIKEAKHTFFCFTAARAWYFPLSSLPALTSSNLSSLLSFFLILTYKMHTKRSQIYLYIRIKHKVADSLSKGKEMRKYSRT